MAIIINNQSPIEHLVAENIAAAHGFTTRFGGVSQGYLDSLNIGMHRGDEPANVAENYRRLAKAIGFSADKMVLAHQTHSDIVRVVTEKDCLGSLSHRDYPECDALVTNTPGITLVVFTADCTPFCSATPLPAQWAQSTQAGGVRQTASLPKR